jgi:DHA3 family macrolide efflux protein-like MFS transporter
VELLRAASGFRSLLIASFASGIGTMLAVIALTVDVYERTGSGAWVSALLIADFLPTIAIGLLLGPLIDRLSRRALMIGADLARLVVFAALPFAANAGTIVALALVVGVANGFFNPAAQAALPNLVRANELARANSLYQSSSNVTWLIGPLAGGALLAISGTDLAYGINAATFAVSALFIARIPAPSFASEQAVSKGHWRDLAEGFALVRRSRALLAVTVAWTLATFGNAAINVAEVFFVRESLDAGNVELGLMMGAAGLGLVLGSIVVGSLLEQRPIAPVYAVSLLLMAVGFGGAAISPSVWVALPLVAVSGLGNGGAVVCNPLLVQVGAPDRLRGRAFTVVMSITYVAFAAAMVAAGALTDALGPRVLWGAAAGICAVAAVAGALLARGIRAVPRDEHEDAVPVTSVPVVGVGERVT